MATTSAWLIGSYRGLPRQDLLVDGHEVSIDAGNFYLYDSTAGLSLLAQIVAAMTEAGVVGASAVLLKNRKVRISATDPFSIDWSPDNTLSRRLLGFADNLSGANSYIAENVSVLLWSPGRTESPTMAPLGVLGHERFPVFAAVSPLDGSVSVVTHGSSRVFNEFRFSHVGNARYQTVDAAGGEWATFFANVCALGRSFNLWRNVVEDDASTDPAVFSTKLGAYILSPSRDGFDWTFTRSPGGNFQNTDRRHECSLAVHVVPEYVNS